MTDNGSLDDRFRTATRQLDEQPIRWARVARAKRRYRLVAILGTIALTLTLATAALFAKTVLDPDFEVPLFEASIVEPSFGGAPGQQRLGEYLHDMGLPTTGMSRRERRELGLVFAVRIRAKGAAGTRFRVRWSMYEADSRTRLRAALYQQAALLWQAEAPDHSRTFRMWVPYPPRPGRYFLRYQLEDASGEPVAVSNTKVFKIRWVPPLD